MEFFFLGLGNPEQYRGTRHNIGKDLVEGLVHQSNGEWKKIGKGKIASLLIGPHVITCAVSNGFMNETGKDLKEILKEINPERLLVIHDEMDKEVGTTRLSYNKGPAGHNGVASIMHQIGTEKFSRLRIGIGRGNDSKKHALEMIPKKDLQVITKTLKESLPNIIDQLLKQKTNK